MEDKSDFFQYFFTLLMMVYVLLLILIISLNIISIYDYELVESLGILFIAYLIINGFLLFSTIIMLIPKPKHALISLLFNIVLFLMYLNLINMDWVCQLCSEWPKVIGEVFNTSLHLLSQSSSVRDEFLPATPQEGNEIKKGLPSRSQTILVIITNMGEWLHLYAFW